MKKEKRMRKGFFAAFVAALSIFAAVPSYAKVLYGSIDDYKGIDTVGWHHDGTGWKYQNSEGRDVTGFIWVNGRLYHLDEETHYCDLDTTRTKTTKTKNRASFECDFTFDKTGALTENGAVVDLGHKDGEFTFLTFDINRASNGSLILDRNYCQETEKKALRYRLKPTGEKIYWGEVSDYNYCGWVIDGPGFADNGRIKFYDETAQSETTLGKMKEHPEHIYSLRLFISFIDAVSILENVSGLVSPASSLVPAGYLPTP